MQATCIVNALARAAISDVESAVAPSLSACPTLCAPYAVGRLIELMDSEDERVAVVACNAILDRGLGKPGPVKEEKDGIEARLANMTREKRLALMRDMRERMGQFLPSAQKHRRLSSPSST
jgi:hypothetical protein